MNHFKKVILAILINGITSCILGQDTTKEVEMADMMRSNGRIYVVVAVMLIILVGLILYLIRLDKKILKLEKQSETL